MRTIITIFLTALALQGTAQEVPTSASDTLISTIIVVRHAEKGTDDPRNPSLSTQGQERAERLAHLLKDIAIDAFYATPFKRTNETLAPLAKANGKEVLPYAPGDRKAFEALVEKGKGKRIVIAGHSNTVPPMVNSLLGKKVFSELDENEYGKIWFIVFQGNRVLDFHVLNY